MINQFFSSIWKSRRLITTWTKYNIQANYLDTKLGAIWIVLQPLLMTLVYSFIFSVILNRRPRGEVPFISFFLSGMILWVFFNSVMMRSTTLMATNVNLMGQVKFPKEALVYVFFSEQLVEFFISFAILLLLSVVNGYYPSWTYIYIPPILLTFFAIALGGMFLLTTIGLFIRDVPKFLSLFLRFLFYASGIIFPADMLPKDALQILTFNPIFFLVESFRNIIFYAEVPNAFNLGIWFIVSLVILFVGFSFFKSKAGIFADYK